MTLDPELKARWVAALRSGDYTQTRFNLARDDLGIRAVNRSEARSFCCLGVLSYIAGDKTLMYDHLPPKVQDEAINRNDGRAAFKGSPQTFSQIADWIEVNDDI